MSSIDARKKPRKAPKKVASKLDKDDDLDFLKPKTLLRHEDTLDLTQEQLDEEIGRVLSTQNPQWVVDQVVYSYKMNEFVPKPLPTTGKAYVIYTYQGTAIRRDSEEAKSQIRAGYGAPSLDDSGPKKSKAKKDEGGEGDEEDDEEESQPQPAAEMPDIREEEEAEEDEKPPGDGTADAATEADEDRDEIKADEEETPMEETAAEEDFVIVPRVKKLANQFNFCERAALTYNNPTRAIETQTVPPSRATYSATALQNIIFDFYQEDYAKKMKEKEGEKPKRAKKKVTVKKKSEKEIHDEALAQRVRESWSILERLVNQNIYDEITQDYRYWEDPSDEFRDGEGSVLPLWKFSYFPMRRHTVTDLFWNPHYYDLFGVSFGSLDFAQYQKNGCLCLFTVKNPAYPEYAVETDSAVICLDIHKKYPYLVCVGLYDGNVCVYNTQLALEKNYQYKSDSVKDKHSSLVWEIKWGPDLIDGEPSFISISSDGRVVHWAVMPGELLATTIIHLFLEQAPTAGPDGTLVPIKGCGSAICFHPEKADIFLVGTEEGLIHKCCKAYSRSYLSTFKAHHLPIYRIDYNKFSSDVFISCSGDWRVKIWEDGRAEPLFMFDLGSCVGDVKWAPYSSTVFAACTSEGKVFIFDLNVNKYKPICIQNIVSKKTKKLTRIDFNYKLPTLILGDNKGTVHLVKLSPNLRVMCKPPKKNPNLDQRTMQIQKLQKLLSLVRDPPFTPGEIDEKFEED